MKKQHGAIVGTFDADSHSNRTESAMVYFDASPRGVSAWLEMHGEPVAYLADEIFDMDCTQLQIPDRGETGV